MLGESGLNNLLRCMNVAATRQRIAEGWPYICAFHGDDFIGVTVVKPPTHLSHLFVRSDLQRMGIVSELMQLADD